MSLSYSMRCTSLSKSKYSGTTLSSSPVIFCKSTLPNTPVDEAASTNKNFSAFSFTKFPNKGSLINISLISSKAFRWAGVGLNSFFELVRGVKMPICLITVSLTTRLSEFTRPKKARTAFLHSGNLNSLIFCMRRGSATR